VHETQRQTAKNFDSGHADQGKAQPVGLIKQLDRNLKNYISKFQVGVNLRGKPLIILLQIFFVPPKINTQVNHTA